MLANSHKTAISRKGPSVPCRWLHKQGLLAGRILDWGCGRGQDRAWLDGQHIYAVGHDPHYRPKKPLKGLLFETVLCTYVLNCIPNYFDRALIVEEALEYLAPGGWLYVSIRANKKDLKGWTSKGTWQGYVGMDLFHGGFRIIRRTRDHEIWGWQRPA